MTTVSFEGRALAPTHKATLVFSENEGFLYTDT